MLALKIETASRVPQKMTSFVFKEVEYGHEVYYRSRLIGEILPIKEVSGRHSFYLGCDNRPEPRTYRGMDKAAEALLAIHKLRTEAAKKGWPMETLIVRAWDVRPRASPR